MSNRLEQKALTLQAGILRAMEADLKAERVAHEEMKRQLERMRGLLDGVLSEAGMQAHRMGCEKRLKRHRDWNDFAPCRGCAAEAALEER